MPRKVTVDEEALVRDYTDGGMAIYDLCDAYHIGKVKVKAILAAHGVELRKRGAQPTIGELKVDDFKVRKYEERDGYHIVVYDPETDFESKDIENRGGALTTYIEKQYGVPTPTLYDRRMYYMKNGDYWWEQWLSVRYDEDKEVKRCPYCGWKTVDVENRSGYFAQHLRNEHGITPEQHLKKYPDDAGFFLSYGRKVEREVTMVDPSNYVECPACGKKMFRMTHAHITSHGMSMSEFRHKYPSFKMESDYMMEKDRAVQKHGQKAPRKHPKRSKAEKEIAEFLRSHGVVCETNNRSLLEGREVDILIEERKLCIEYSGLRYHSVEAGNTKVARPIEKTRLANKKGYGFIHIYEDEYMNNKELVFDKLLDILGKNYGLVKVYGRKCAVRPIQKNEAEAFINAFHMQGFPGASVYLGAFHDKELVAVMTFKRAHMDMGAEWELNRYATNIRYRCVGVAGKLFSHFIKFYDPASVVSFADRRWAVTPYGTMYTKIGFGYDGETVPSYTYFKKYNAKGEDRLKRHHKLNFRRHVLLKKHPELDPALSEEEMANRLGFLRIYDCGMFRYVWTKK